MKILDLDKLAEELSGLKSKGKKIVHCHGCFDMMHPGHIKYFQASKKMGDILVVTVTPDQYVDKGPDRPIFDQFFSRLLVKKFYLVVVFFKINHYMQHNTFVLIKMIKNLLHIYFSLQFNKQQERTMYAQRKN